jgi:hypothetical protein
MPINREKMFSKAPKEKPSIIDTVISDLRESKEKAMVFGRKGARNFGESSKENTKTCGF